MYRVPHILPVVILLSACTGQSRVAAPAPVPLPAPVAATAPHPPDGAATQLTIPARLADGSFATPNRNLSAAGAAWHLRAAFNVAVLSCPDTALATSYNRLLTVHRKRLAAAHRALVAEHGGTAKFDPAMTRLYNYFAQPPVLPRFCATANPLLREAAALPPESFDEFAPSALAAIDRPFADFYARYDAWRADMAAWRAGATPIPRLGYDPAVFTTAAVVTGGSTKLAAR